MEFCKHLKTVEIMSYMKQRWGLVAVAEEVASPCAGKYARLANRITKAENYFMRTTADLTNICLICKVVFFRFCGTRKTTLKRQCQKLCVS